MAAAIPVIITAAKVVGTVISVVTMVKGIKDGNLLQAVAGGFGAFMGVSSLMSSVGSSATAAATAAAPDAAGAAASTASKASSFMNTASPFGAAQATNTLLPGGLASPVTDLATSSTGLLSGTATDSMLGAAMGADKALAAPSLMDRLASGASSIGGFMKENPQLMQTAGGLLAGYSQGQMVEEKMKNDERLADEERTRRGYWATPTSSPFAVPQR